MARDWEGSRESNLKALELVLQTEEGPEAWNLGIAATALGDWRTARRAWRAFGLTIDGDGDEPIEMDFGLAPIRLNPDPRFAEEALEIDGHRFATEVVWATRLCPTRARIESVPFPDSGHRFGDVVLHDGDPVGERRLGDQVRSVFNEIALLDRSPWPTLVVESNPVPQADLDELNDLFRERGFAAECWTTNIQVLCKACSEGPSDHRHDHAPGDEPGREATSHVIGIGGAAMDAAQDLLGAWAAAGAGRELGELELA